MIYLKVQENEYPAYISGRLIDRDWDGRASKSITLTMTHAQAAQLFTDGLGWSIVQRETVPDGTDGGGTETVQEWDNADYCVAGPITDHRDGQDGHIHAARRGAAADRGGTGMTKLEEKLLAQIRARLAELDVRASDKLAALLPALRKLTEGYAALGAAAKKTLAGLIPELAALIEAAEDALR